MTADTPWQCDAEVKRDILTVKECPIETRFVIFISKTQPQNILNVYFLFGNASFVLFYV